MAQDNGRPADKGGKGDEQDDSEDVNLLDETADDADLDDTDDADDTAEPVSDVDKLKRANKATRDDNRRLARENRELKRGKATPAKGDDGDARQPTEREVRMETRIKRDAVKTALMEAGATGKYAGLLTSSVSLDDLDVDDRDEVSGVRDVVDELRESHPELFKSEDDEPPARRRALGAGEGRRRESGAPAKSSTDRLVDQLTGRR